MQLDLIEERQFARLRMLDYRGRKLPNAQAVVILPFEIQRGPAALIFDLCSIACLKKLLPTHIQPIREVADVHQTVALEAIENS